MRGIVREESSVQAKTLTENKIPIIKIRDNNVRMPVIKQGTVRNYHILLIFARLIEIIINNAFVMTGWLNVKSPIMAWEHPAAENISHVNWIIPGLAKKTDIRKRVPVLRYKRQTNAAPMTVPIMTNVSVAVTLSLVDLHRSAAVPAVAENTHLAARLLPAKAGATVIPALTAAAEQGNAAVHVIRTVIPAQAVIKAAAAAAGIHRPEKHLNPALAAQLPVPATNVLITALPAAEVLGAGILVAEAPRLLPILGKSGASFFPITVVIMKAAIIVKRDRLFGYKMPICIAKTLLPEK